MRRVSTAAPAGTIHANFRSSRTVALAFALSALAVVGALLALAPAASAAKETFATLGAAEGPNGGQFSQPRGIAVNQSGNGAPAGTFYVVDAANNRVQQFSPSGAFVRAWGWGVRSGEADFEVCTVAAKCLKGTAGTNAGQLSNAQGIAVDQNTGNVFVANSGSRRVSVFKANGVFMGAFGWGALDGAGSLQFCTTGTGCGAPGAFPPGSGSVGGGQFGTIGGLATDAEGNLYVANRTSRRIDVFKPLLTGSAVTGIEFLRSFGWGAATGADEFEVCTASPCSAPAGTGTAAGQFGGNSPADVGVDGAGNVYALDSGNRRVQKFSPAPAPLTGALGSDALSGAFSGGNLIALAVEPESDHVLVLGNRAGESNRVAVFEMTSEGEAVAVHGTPFKGTQAAGVAAAQPSNGGTVYYSSSAEQMHRVFALNHPGLDPTIEPVTGIAATEATFNASVVSNEVESAYRFEYFPAGGDWTIGPQGAVAPQPGSAEVQENVSELVPNTKYGVRLTAMRPAGSWERVSGIASFTTPPIAPAVGGGMATQVTANTARLVAYVNPNNSDTSYRFEYGTTEAYGSSTPTATVDGSKEVTVSRLIEGLQANTTYHFRVVAINQAGETVGPVLTFTTRDAIPDPPAGRAYELVSPAENNGQIISQSEGTIEATAAPSGEAVAYEVVGPVPGSKSGGFIGHAIAYRGPDGWTTDPLAPPQDPAPIVGSPLKLTSEDLSRVGIQGPLAPQPAPGGGEGISNLFLLEPKIDRFRTVSLNTPSIPGTKVEGVGGSPDLSVVLFRYRGAEPLVEGGPTDEALHMWTEDAETMDIVARWPQTNEPFQSQSFLASFQPHDNAVSDDGSRIFFGVTENSDQLYVRINGTETKHVSKSQKSDGEFWEEASAQFGHASTDGSVAFFTSTQRLTDDSTTNPEASTADLYRYEVHSEELTDITVDPGSENGAEVLGVLGGSEGGTVVYFAARGVLAPGAEAGAANVYMWRDDGTAKGAVEFVAKDVHEDNYAVSAPYGTDRDNPARISPDGSELLFTAEQSLTDYPTNGYLQAYLYDAAADHLVCVSCNPMGGPVTANVDATGAGDVPDEAQTLTDDGERVFFNSVERLVPEDEDSGLDTYEYESRSGRVTLLSSGKSDKTSMFQDASADGRDVFFLTKDALVGIDRNETMDLYDARIGGGFASQNPPPPPLPCGPGECQAPTPAAPPPVPGSVTVQGPGNQVQKGKRAQKPKKCRKQGKGKGKKKRGKRCAGKAGKRHGRR